MGTRSKNRNQSLTGINRDFYNALWRGVDLYEAQVFNTWPAISPHIYESKDRLEIGPGLRPRLPVKGTRFVDLSAIAIERLNQGGGRAVEGSIESLPIEDQAVSLLCAFDVLEHVENDRAALAEMTRVMKPGAVMFLSVPLHQSAWTSFDDIVGHARRYDPEELLELLAEFGVTVRRSAVYGMELESRTITKVGMWFLKHFSKFSLRFYNKHVFPKQLKKQEPLTFSPGIIRDPAVSEVVIECVKQVPSLSAD